MQIFFSNLGIRNINDERKKKLGRHWFYNKNKLMNTNEMQKKKE